MAEANDNYRHDKEIKSQSTISELGQMDETNSTSPCPGVQLRELVPSSCSTNGQPKLEFMGGAEATAR
jgi:hypothetical protein